MREISENSLAEEAPFVPPEASQSASSLLVPQHLLRCRFPELSRSKPGLKSRGVCRPVETIFALIDKSMQHH